MKVWMCLELGWSLVLGFQTELLFSETTWLEIQQRNPSCNASAVIL